MRKIRTFPRALLLVVLAALLSLDPVDSTTLKAHFCRDVVQKALKCPDVPAVEGFDLSQLKGGWFEVGASSQMALGLAGQQGGQCVTFSFSQSQSPKNTLTFQSRALLSVSPMRQAQSAAVSQGALASGAGVKFLCQFLAGQEPLQTILPFLTSTDVTLPNLAKLPRLPANASVLLSDKSISDIAQGILQLIEQLPAPFSDVALVIAGNGAPTSSGSSAPVKMTAPVTSSVASSLQDDLKRFLAQYAQADIEAVLSSAVRMVYAYASLPNDTLSSTVSVTSLNGIIALQSIFSQSLSTQEQAKIGAQCDIITQAVNDASTAAASVFGFLEQIQRSNALVAGAPFPKNSSLSKVLSNIQGQVDSIKGACMKLNQSRDQIFSAAAAIQQVAGAKEPVVSQAAGAISTLSELVGPVGLSLADIAIGVRVVLGATNSVQSEQQKARIIEADGKATSNGKNGGALEMTWNSITQSTKYSIIKREQLCKNGCDTALLYNCDADYTTGFLPEVNIFVLSQTPNVSQTELDEALKFASEQGAFLGGANVILPISQDAGMCRPSRP